MEKDIPRCKLRVNASNNYGLTSTVRRGRARFISTGSRIIISSTGDCYVLLGLRIPVVPILQEFLRSLPVNWLSSGGEIFETSSIEEDAARFAVLASDRAARYLISRI